MARWLGKDDLTTIQAVHGALSTRLSSVLSRYHKPELQVVEQDIVDFLHRWVECCHNKLTGCDAFYDLDDQIYFDFNASVPRDGGIEAHFKGMQAHLSDLAIFFREMEITAVTSDFAHVTSVQKVQGVSDGGKKYEYVYRITQLLRKTEGAGWRYVHEHVSFPVDLETGQAEMT